MERYVIPILSRYVAVSVNCEESYEYRWQQAGQKVKPGFKLAGKLVFLPHCAMARRV